MVRSLLPTYPAMNPNMSREQPRTLEVFHYLGALPDMQAIYKLLVPEHHYRPGSLEVEKTIHLHQLVDPTPDVPYVSPEQSLVMSGADSRIRSQTLCFWARASHSRSSAST